MDRLDKDNSDNDDTNMDRLNNDNSDNDDTNIDADDLTQPTAQHTPLTDMDERNDTTNSNTSGKTPAAESKHNMTEEIQQLKDKVEEYQSLYRKSMDEIDALRRDISDMKEQAENDARERDELRTQVECLRKDLERFISLTCGTHPGEDKPLTRKRSFVKRVLSVKAKKGQKLSEMDDHDETDSHVSNSSTTLKKKMSLRRVSNDKNNQAPKNNPQENVKEVEKERQEAQNAEERSNVNDNVPNTTTTTTTTHNIFGLRRASVENNHAPKKNQETVKDDNNVPIATTQNKFSLRRVSVENNTTPKKSQEHAKDDCNVVPITTTQNKFSLRRISTEGNVKDAAEKERQPLAEGRLNLRNIFNFAPADTSTCSATSEGESSVANDGPAETAKDQEMSDVTTVKEKSDVDGDEDPDDEEEDQSAEETTVTKDSNEEDDEEEEEEVVKVEQPVEETTAPPVVAPVMGLWGMGRGRMEENKGLPQEEVKGFGLFRFQQPQPQPQPQQQQDKGSDPAEDNESEILRKPSNEDTSSDFPPPRGIGALFKRASVKTPQSVKLESNPEATTDTTEDNHSEISSKVSIDDSSDVTPPRGLGSLFKRASSKTQHVKFETNLEVVIDQQRRQPEVEDNESAVSSKVSIDDDSDVTPPRGLGSLFKRASSKTQQSVKFATNPEVMTVKVHNNADAATTGVPETTTTSKIQEPSNVEASNDSDDNNDDSPAVETTPASYNIGLAAFFQQSQPPSQNNTPQEDQDLASDAGIETDDTPTDQPPTSESPDDSPTHEPPPTENDASSQPPPNNNIFSLRHLIRTPSQMPSTPPDNKPHPQDSGNNTTAETNDNRPPHWRQKSGGLQGLFQFKPSQRAPFNEPIDETSSQDFNDIDSSSSYWNYYNKEDSSDDDDDDDDGKEDNDDKDNEEEEEEKEKETDNEEDDDDDDQLMVGFPQARKRSILDDHFEKLEKTDDRPSMTSLEASTHSKSSWSLQLTM